jgi:hypothetical protein
MLNAPSYVVSREGNVTVMYNRKSHMIAVDHPNYHKIKEALKLKNFKNFEKLLDTGAALKKLSKGVCTVQFGEVYFNGQPLHNVVTTRILQLMREGFPFEPMLRFLENLMMNPSERSRNELYGFLEHHNIPITEDGCFLAYKSVSGDYYSKASGSLKLESGSDKGGRILNKPGEKIRCSRSQVDDEAGRTCSNGLHVGALSYSGPGGWYNHSGDKCVVVKVNPADAVSVPADHNAQKLRVCAYEVLYDYDGALEAPVYSGEGQKYNYDDSQDYSDDETSYDNAYVEGKEAFRNGELDDDNPYDYDSNEDAFYGWEDGYNDAEYEAESEAEVDDDDDCDDDEPALGVKPNGSRYHAKRDSRGRFISK